MFQGQVVAAGVPGLRRAGRGEQEVDPVVVGLGTVAAELGLEVHVPQRDPGFVGVAFEFVEEEDQDGDPVEEVAQWPNRM
ncbi:hypothetical protein ACFZDG_33710 [Kitasatospora xanthocidica]|uniref:hypothetical protein n=1 Tax=Kitasatospora xanthocidica TaxID=83382 RepID=UPI0036E021CB